MMAAAPPTCWTPSATGRSCWPTAPTTAMRSATASPAAVPGPTSSRSPAGSNKPAFSPFLYRYRNLVERFFNKLKHFRAVATRFEKHDANYLALVKLARCRIWMRAYELVA